MSTSRLLTLTGAGGTGKTRLALHLAADVLDRFPDGAWLVELAPVTDPAAVGPTVASALHIPERTGHAVADTISAFLQGHDLLLVLDNCEHLIAACAELAAVLIRSCPRLKILSTSREGLNVPGEALMPVPSLRVPVEDPLPPLDQLREYEAIRLFVDRGTAYQSSFALSDDNAADVVRICRRLDGIPLALELAAARVRSLSVAQVAQRLDDRFRLLTGGGRTVAAAPTPPTPSDSAARASRRCSSASTAPTRRRTRRTSASPRHSIRRARAHGTWSRSVDALNFE